MTTKPAISIPAPAGAEWLIESVSAEDSSGEKNSLGRCPILHVNDARAFMDAVGHDTLAAIANGTSIRVKCQDLGRSGIRRKLSLDDMARRCLNWLSGVRNTGVRTRVETVTVTETVTVKVRMLPDGTPYTGNDLTEYRQLFIAASVDMGVPVERAADNASRLTLD